MNIAADSDGSCTPLKRNNETPAVFGFPILLNAAGYDGDLMMMFLECFVSFDEKNVQRRNFYLCNEMLERFVIFGGIETCLKIT